MSTVQHLEHVLGLHELLRLEVVQQAEGQLEKGPHLNQNTLTLFPHHGQALVAECQIVSVIYHNEARMQFSDSA